MDIKFRVLDDEFKDTPAPPMTRVFVIGDTQQGPHIKRSHAKYIGRAIAEDSILAARLNQKFYVVHIGDLGAFDSFTRHEGDHTMAGRSIPTHDADMDDVELFLKDLKGNVRRNGVEWDNLNTVFCYGNHERRVYDWENDNPREYGAWSSRLDQMIAESFKQICRYKEKICIDGVDFTHCTMSGNGKPKTNQNITWVNANKSNRDIVTGHTHKAGVTRVAAGFNDFVTAVDVGSSMPYNHYEQYAVGSAIRWWWGVVSLTIIESHIESWRFTSMTEMEAMYEQSN